MSLFQEKMEYDKDQNHYRCTYICRVRFTFKDQRMLESTGRATGGASSQCTVIEFAKKNAVTDAIKKGFERLAIIVSLTAFL